MRRALHVRASLLPFVVAVALAPIGGAYAQTPAPPAAARQLMTEGRAAIAREDYAAAVSAFARLLALPENSLTADAQEFLGLSYQLQGNIPRARQEYENYLKRYPRGEDATLIKQRLASLPPAAAPKPEVRAAPPQPSDDLISLVKRPQLMTFGGVSQFYYRGNSHIDAQPLTPNPFGRTTLSITDQSALYTSIDLNARLATDAHDNRIVFRDTDLLDFLGSHRTPNRLMAAYYDYRYKPADVSARVGRQPGYTGGVIGRFDGGLFGYGITPRMRLNVVAGQPVQLNGFDIDSNRRWFYGVNADLGPFNNHWSGNVYLIRQSVDGIPDRQASGMALRYLAPQVAFISLLDYDTLFHEMNIAMAQGTWQSASKTTLNFLLDRRKTPTLETATAALGQPSTSIRTLLDTLSEEEVRRQALALTATVSTASAGFMHPVSQRWQLGADYVVMHVSGTQGSGIIPAIPDTGRVRTASAQAIGTGLFSRRDVTAVTVSRTAGVTFHGAALGVNTRVPVGDKWALGASFLAYRQHNDDGSTSRRLFAMLHAEYQWRANVSLEAEAGIDNTHSRGEFADEKFDRTYFSLGYRWDF